MTPALCTLAGHFPAVASNLATLHGTTLSAGMRKRHCSPEVQIVCCHAYATVGRCPPQIAQANKRSSFENKQTTTKMSVKIVSDKHFFWQSFYEIHNSFLFCEMYSNMHCLLLSVRKLQNHHLKANNQGP